MLAHIWGPSFFTRLAFFVSIAVVVTLFITTFFTFLYQRFIYTKVLRPKFDESYQPKCAVIVPCKGTTKGFEENLRSFCKLDYKNYEVIYTVESAQDGAVATINSVIKDCPQASLVVAGLTKGCCQKNWNQIAALKQAKNPEILAFADADISPNSGWLKELILPLSSPKIVVTTGFRWLHVEKKSLGHQLHFYMNSFLYTLYSFASFVGGVGLWGGSMAMRKKDFDELGVVSRWSETVVDDSSLSEIVKNKHKKSILVTTCITHSDDLIQGTGSAIRWFERQMMFLKAYQKSLWIVAIPIIALTLATLVWLPIAAIIGFTTTTSFFSLFGGAALVLVAGKLLADLMFGLLGPMPRFFTFALYQPLLLGLFLFSCLRTAFTNTVTWSGYKYKVSFFSGKVTHIDRI